MKYSIYLLLIIWVGNFHFAVAQKDKVYRYMSEALKQPNQVYKVDLFGSSVDKLLDSAQVFIHLEDVSIDITDAFNLDKLKQLKSLKKLQVRNSSTALPSIFWSLTQLEHLDLSHTYVTKLPSAIGQLQNLRSLNLSGCKLT